MTDASTPLDGAAPDVGPAAPAAVAVAAVVAVASAAAVRAVLRLRAIAPSRSLDRLDHRQRPPDAVADGVAGGAADVDGVGAERRLADSFGRTDGAAVRVWGLRDMHVLNKSIHMI